MLERLVVGRVDWYLVGIIGFLILFGICCCGVFISGIMWLIDVLLLW